MTDHPYPFLRASRVLGIPYSEALRMTREEADAVYCGFAKGATDLLVESTALRMAVGNNGGCWAEHYTEDQRDHWRRLAASLVSDIKNILTPPTPGSRPPSPGWTGRSCP